MIYSIMIEFFVFKGSLQNDVIIYIIEKETKTYPMNLKKYQYVNYAYLLISWTRH